MSATIKIKWHGPAWMAKFMQGAERNMDTAAIALQAHIIQKISIGQPPSKPGEPPHVLEGHLHRNIAWDRVRALVRKVGVGIGNREKIGYALWLEFGTRPHAIEAHSVKAKTKKIKERTMTGKGKFITDIVIRRGYSVVAHQHPGMAARPYLRPGLYEFRDELVRIMTTPIKMA